MRHDASVHVVLTVHIAGADVLPTPSFGRQARCALRAVLLHALAKHPRPGRVDHRLDDAARVGEDARAARPNRAQEGRVACGGDSYFGASVNSFIHVLMRTSGHILVFGVSLVRCISCQAFVVAVAHSVVMGESGGDQICPQFEGRGRPGLSAKQGGSPPVCGH